MMAIQMQVDLILRTLSLIRAVILMKHANLSSNKYIDDLCIIPFVLLIIYTSKYNGRYNKDGNQTCLSTLNFENGRFYLLPTLEANNPLKVRTCLCLKGIVHIVRFEEVEGRSKDYPNSQSRSSNGAKANFQ